MAKHGIHNLTKNPIAEYKEEDVVHMRGILLDIINDPDTTRKDKIEASKLMLRAHHSLQVDRTTIRATATANPVDKLDKPLSKKEQGEIDDLIKPKS